LTKRKPTLDILEDIALQCRPLRKHQDKLIKQLLDLIVESQKQHQLNKIKEWKELNVKAKLDELKALQQQLSGNLNEEEYGLFHDTDYFCKQAHWLISRFPEGVYTDVEGLCKIVTRKEIEDKDWSLSPGRYVGVASVVAEDFDYEERLNEIHIELESLNEEAAVLAKAISDNYKALAI
jgi:type I restriction enzyme M protein